MHKIYSTDKLSEIEYIKDLLDAEGIAYLVKNQALSGAMGEIPPIECWPQIWIRDDDCRQRAREIIDAVVHPAPVNSRPWTCACGEQLEAQFSNCWQCGRPRPD